VVTFCLRDDVAAILLARLANEAGSTPVILKLQAELYECEIVLEWYHVGQMNYIIYHETT